MRSFIIFPIFVALSTIASAATPIDLSETERWAIENILNGERFAIVVNGKSNIIDTPDITRLSALYERFFVNEVAVLKGYKGKPRHISFPVGRVAVERGVPVVYGAWSSPTVKYEFDVGSMDALAKVGRGSVISAICTLRSIERSALEFTKCKDGQEYIDRHIATRRDEIVDFLEGKPARRAETARQAVTLLSLIYSKPAYSPCLQRSAPGFLCYSELENQGKSLIAPGIRESVISKLKGHGFDL